MRRVLYTANFGGYDDLGLLVAQDGPVDCFLFTDDPETQAPPPWTVVVEPGRYEHPRMSAKWYKLMPHVLFPEYEVSLYTDASMHRPSPNLFAWATGHLRTHAPIAAFAHPYFDDVYGDAKLSEELPKYAGLPVAEQVEHYRSDGFPEHAGHFATGVLARRHMELAEFGISWLGECERWTYQDQLSFPVVAMRLGVTVAPFDFGQLACPYVSPGGHRRQD